MVFVKSETYISYVYIIFLILSLTRRGLMKYFCMKPNTVRIASVLARDGNVHSFT